MRYSFSPVPEPFLAGDEAEVEAAAEVNSIAGLVVTKVSLLESAPSTPAASVPVRPLPRSSAGRWGMPSVAVLIHWVGVEIVAHHLHAAVGHEAPDLFLRKEAESGAVGALEYLVD